MTLYILIGGLALIVIFTIIDLTLSILLDFSLILLIDVILLHQLCYLVICLLVYPASFRLYMRLQANNYGRQMAKRNDNQLKHLIKLIEALLEQRIGVFGNLQTINAIKWVESQCLIFTTMKDKYSLNSTQLQYFNLIQTIESILNQQSLKAILQSVVSIRQDQCQTLLNTHQGLLEGLLCHLYGCRDVIELQFKPLPKWQAMQRWLHFDLFGTLDELRAMILLDQRNHRLFVRTAKNVQIDCLFIKNSSTETQPTVLFCNPNAAVYEYLYFDSNWIEFYRQHKINMIMWNYRSYGKSEGSPNPSNLQADANEIIRYFRNNYGIGKFGIHGYSLGGSVAAHCALTQNMDFLIIDRSFSSLGQIASRGMAPLARSIFSTIVGWNSSNYQDYCKYPGFKIVIGDPNDEIVPFLAQPAVAIAKEYFVPYKIKYTNRLDSIFDMEGIQFDQFFQKSIMNNQQLEILQISLSRVQDLITRFHKLEDQFNENEMDQDQDSLKDERDLLVKPKLTLTDIPENYVEQIPENQYQSIYFFVLQMSEIMGALSAFKSNLLSLTSPDHIKAFFACCYSYELHNMSQQVRYFNDSCLKLQNYKIKYLYQDYLLVDIINIQIKINRITDRFSAKTEDATTPDLNSTNQSVELTSANRISVGLTKNNIIGNLVAIQGGHNSNLTTNELLEISELFEKEASI